MIDLSQVLTFSEAADKWGFANGNTLRKAVERNKFLPDEVRKSGDVWLTTYEAMGRVFGEPRMTDITLSYNEISELFIQSVYQQKESQKKIQTLLQSLHTALQENKTISIIESLEHPERIIVIIKTSADLASFERYIRSLSINID
ncbi:MAG: helix-turn-helix domain-containing protein [Beduini sp.]|uniref:helix-turn-helix domain-containing protein n=1 Tax=Beduini sp. TaxID=1922300 RepID=UPI0039A064F8